MSEIRNRILVVDDDPSINEGLEALLMGTWDVRTAANGHAAMACFADFSPDVVLLDLQLPDTTGIELLRQFKMYSEAVAVIMMSGVGRHEHVIESMKLGAETFLQKPFDFDTLQLTLHHVERMIATQRELLALRRGEPHHEKGERLPGISAPINDINRLLGQLARVSSPVLIEGESGTGKGVLARLIHNRSSRSRAPFVDLNCAGLSKELLESELFGHERGAFTNAMSTKPGLLEIAGDGTLLLDEIGELDLTIQARLLKAVEEKRFRRVGGIRDLRADFRLIATTNRDLAAEVGEGRFRNDLYYRLNVVRIRLPSLRERMDDIPVLAAAILPPLAKDTGRPIPKISLRAMKKLESYSWPGNIRELRNVLERALLTTSGNEIRVEDLILENTVAPAAGGNGLPRQEWEIRTLDEVIASYIAAAVEATGGNVRHAARKLEISPATLYARLKAKQRDSEPS